MKCDYCIYLFGKNVLSEDDDTVGIYKNGNRYSIFFEDCIYGMIERRIKFNYCPMCGQKLKE